MNVINLTPKLYAFIFRSIKLEGSSEFDFILDIYDNSATSRFRLVNISFVEIRLIGFILDGSQ